MLQPFVPLKIVQQQVTISLSPPKISAAVATLFNMFFLKLAPCLLQ